jgi:hypothetical protein
MATPVEALFTLDFPIRYGPYLFQSANGHQYLYCITKNLERYTYQICGFSLSDRRQIVEQSLGSHLTSAPCIDYARQQILLSTGSYHIVCVDVQHGAISTVSTAPHRPLAAAIDEDAQIRVLYLGEQSKIFQATITDNQLGGGDLLVDETRDPLFSDQADCIPLSSSRVLLRCRYRVENWWVLYNASQAQARKLRKVNDSDTVVLPCQGDDAGVLAFSQRNNVTLLWPERRERRLELPSLEGVATAIYLDGERAYIGEYQPGQRQAAFYHYLWDGQRYVRQRWWDRLPTRVQAFAYAPDARKLLALCHARAEKTVLALIDLRNFSVQPIPVGRRGTSHTITVEWPMAYVGFERTLYQSSLV